jgi:signal transduction histidine kinase
MAARPITHRNHVIGTLYVGTNITHNLVMFKMFLMILSGLALLFSGLAIYLSHVMSKRAMKPIIEAYTRQQQFTADASHELRTPLRVMLSSIDALGMEKSSASSNEDEFSNRILSNMKDEVKRMTKLVSDLLTLARTDSSLPDLLQEKSDFRPQVEKIVQSLEPIAESKEIQLNLFAPDSLLIKGDMERLKQLVYILLDNALKYTAEGGRVNVSLSIEEDGNPPVFTIVVEDTGVGISAQDQEHIFDRFYRVKSRARQEGGHGLGLSIAMWIVQAHKGTMRVSSEVGQGSTFTVKIPQP